MRVLFGTLRGHVPEGWRITAGHARHAAGTARPGAHLRSRRHDPTGIPAAAVSRHAVGIGRRVLAWNDRLNGYPTYRTWQGLVPTLVGRRLDLNRPDLVIADFQEENPIVDESLRRGIPTLLRIVTVLGTVERQVEIPRHVLSCTFCNSAFGRLGCARATGSSRL